MRRSFRPLVEAGLALVGVAAQWAGRLWVVGVGVALAASAAWRWSVLREG